MAANVALNVMLIPPFGYVGAALASLLSSIGGVAASIALARRRPLLRATVAVQQA
jgi:O-antigen/teichoic acid export membrane protein